MKKRRIILLICIAASGTFVSFFGGSFSYALFYSCFSVVVSCLLYIIFIYFRLKIYQSIETKVTVKGDTIPYKFMLVNEDFIYYSEIKIEFISNYSKIELHGLQQSFSLMPNEKVVQETGLVCLYRGEYKAGIKSVSFTDFLGLFSMKRKYPSEMLIKVYPRIVKLETLAALSFGEDAKVSPFSFSVKQEIPDTEFREYVSGDNPKAINWRLSAKQNKLFVRKYTEIPKESVEMFLDLSPINEKYGMKIALEDKLLETALAISDFYLRKRTISGINFYSDREYNYQTDTASGFGEFYNACLDLKFNSEMNIGRYIKNSIIHKKSVSIIIILTAEINVALYEALAQVNAYGILSVVILVGNHEAGKISKAAGLSEIRSRLAEIKTKLVHIPENNEISDVLDKNEY